MKMISQVIIVALFTLAGVFIPQQAQADTTYYPLYSNGIRIYLSKACHDPTLGSNCVTNTGCSGFSENARSGVIATQVKDDLLSRQFPVRIGTDGAAANVASSNSWGANIHVPLHSNAVGSTPCPGGPASQRGTQPQYRGGYAEELAGLVRDWVGGVSPGTNDVKIFNNSNYENNAPIAVPVYIESEYHIWQSGVNFLQDSASWATRIGAAIDICKGYPRYGQGATQTPVCSW
jgi:hypothetical protein